MAPTNMIEDVAAIVAPMPRRDDYERMYPDEPDLAGELWNDACNDVMRQQEELARQLTETNEDGEDALLEAVALAREERDAAAQKLRRLLAYGREFHGRRGVPLRSLGSAAGIAHSNVAKAYGREDVDSVAELLQVPTPAIDGSTLTPASG
jgi:hypothetical protein